MSQMSATARQAWQLHMFHRSLKKRLKLAALLELVGELGSESCLLVTCGDNNGALNWHFRAHGGQWTWADVSGSDLSEMSAFLGEEVHDVPEEPFPFADAAFDLVVSIDVLEHLDDHGPFLHELARVTRPGGRVVVTVPNGDPRLLANKIKWRVGMTPAVYGHTRAGYTVAELAEAVAEVGLRPGASGGYSRFFTEMAELAINFGYVFVLRRKRGPRAHGQIAPTSGGELKTHGLAYRLYGLALPFLRLVSSLDRLLPARTNNAVIVSATREAS